MPAKLYSLPVSHPALAARCMLEHKGIEHRVVQLFPGFQPVVRLLGFPRYTVPALVVGRRKVQGSREISRVLDEIKPDPPLFPREPGARRAVEDAEEWGERVLQAVARRIVRWSLAHEYEVRRWLAEVSRIPAGAAVARPPLQAKLFARAAGATDEAVRADLAALPAHLDEVERLRAEGVIGGEAPNAADFQIASSLRSLGKIGDLTPYVGEHPAMRWAETVVHALPGPVPPALPREWLAPLSAASS